VISSRVVGAACHRVHIASVVMNKSLCGPCVVFLYLLKKSVAFLCS
jgi:hypothetical protein